MDDSNVSRMMDPGAREGDASPIVHNYRKCWAMQRLINEMETLFPETTYEVSGYNGRNVGLDVTFDLTTLDVDLRTPVTDLLRLLRSDARVAEVLEDDDSVLIQFISSPRTQDSRDTFNLSEAWTTLTEPDWEYDQ